MSVGLINFFFVLSKKIGYLSVFVCIITGSSVSFIKFLVNIGVFVLFLSVRFWEVLSLLCGPQNGR